MIQRFALFVVFALASVSAFGQAALTINGVADKTVYTDSASFSVPSVAGYTYAVTLDGQLIATDVTHTSGKVDYHEVFVVRTNTSTLAVTNRLVRFIIVSSQRVNGSAQPELGLIVWTPYPPVPSTAAEAAGAQLDILVPANYPLGLDIPVIARVNEADDRVRRVNGWVSGGGASPWRVVRGHGFGFLPPQTSAGTINYNAQLSALSAPRQIQIEASTTWSNVSGIISSDTVWPTNSRIALTTSLTINAGATLTVEPGTVVKLNPLVNITNNGSLILNGTAAQPVVFTPTNQPAPEINAGAWGGILMRANAARLVANYAILAGGGGQANFKGAGGFTGGAESHRNEQPLLLVQNGSAVLLTNCALINQAGQIANGLNSTIVYDHCLLQRAITAGEHVGCTITVNKSAVIEFPSIDGIYSGAIADADYDGIYLTTGTHVLRDSLFGFAKDDAIDSGSGGAGTVLVTNCWVESALHEALAWSGGGRQTRTCDSVLMNCGQGIEAGWSTGVNSPLVFASNLLSTANSVGARYGDNYSGTTGLGLKTGFLTVTNSFILYNYRDVWGQVWDDTWNYRTAQMDLQNNYLTVPNTNHPANVIWNPAADGPRLAAFMTTPANAPVGIGVATWSNQYPMFEITNGIPVRLSSFTTNSVTVNYLVENSSGALASGALTFAAGETVKRIYPTGFDLNAQTFVRVSLNSPVRGEVTGRGDVFFVKPEVIVTPPGTTLVASNGTWKYNDQGVDLSTAWRPLSYSDVTWSNGVAQLGFGDSDEAVGGLIRKTNAAGAQLHCYYFRKTFVSSNVNQFATLSLWLLRDDGGVVYLNGNEVFRSDSMPPTQFVINYNTLATNYNNGAAPPDNTVDKATISATNLVLGTNIIAVEIHQQATNSSDLSFDFALAANPAPPAGSQTLRLGRWDSQFTLGWSDNGYVLEMANTVTGTWQQVTAPSPLTVAPTNPQQYFRLKK